MGGCPPGAMKRSLILQEFLVSSFWVGGVKTPGADPPSGISLVDVLILTERHPACRQREARSGSCMERENLAGDAPAPQPPRGTASTIFARAPDLRTRAAAFR